MRNVFKEHFKLTDTQTKELWESSLIVPDANVILNLYRYSAQTNSVFFDLLNSFKERLWIPHQVAREFLKKRITVIEQQIKTYHDAIKDISQLEEMFINKKRNPFLSEQLSAKLSALFDEVEDELLKSKTNYEEKLLNDRLFNKIAALFDGKIGEEFEDSEIADIVKEGEHRYQKKIPPGFEDSGKSDNRFGDLILWKQIIYKAKTAKQSVIFITDDAKGDWWEISSGRTLGPRSELRKEFFDFTGTLFHMYSPFSFMKYATENLALTITDNSLSEVKELKPIQGPPENLKPSLLITAIIKKSPIEDDFNLLLDQIKSAGYDIRIEQLDSDIVKIIFSIPNIPDLPRRIEKKLFNNISDFGCSLIEYNYSS